MREIFIIYYGLGMAGKTTNLDALSSIFQTLKIDRFHLSTTEGKTVYLDTLLMVIKIKGSEEHMKVCLFSVPGQERFAVVRSWIFSNADGFVFVVDPTQPIEKNIQVFNEIKDYIQTRPVVVQINKKDIARNLDETKKIFHSRNIILASVKSGEGIKETFLSILKEVIENGVGK